MLSKTFALLMLLVSLGQGVITDFENDISLGGNLFLVNRDYMITADYVPDDLVMPNVRRNSSSVLMRREAAEALEKMFQAAKDEKNYTLVAVSGYRSYQTQQSIYRRRVKNSGEAKARLYVALPGASEHQLGLAMDIGRRSNTKLKAAFGNTPEGKWVAENCYRFGFILRYKAEWTETTGYAYEPWHVRYVGVEHAKRIQEYDIPLEDYIALIRTASETLSEQGDQP